MVVALGEFHSSSSGIQHGLGILRLVRIPPAWLLGLPEKKVEGVLACTLYIYWVLEVLHLEDAVSDEVDGIGRHLQRFLEGIGIVVGASETVAGPDVGLDSTEGEV